MNRTLVPPLAGWLMVLLLGLGGITRVAVAGEIQPRPVPANQKNEPIDFEKARELLRKQRAGERLSENDTAYLRRAQAARRQQNPEGERAPRESTGLKPLVEMTAEDRYKGEDGGLYGGGSNTPPSHHRQVAEAAIAKIQPLDANGRPVADGRIAFVSISMSNATQEFSLFKRLADADPVKSARVTIVDCAQGGQAMAEWVRPDAPPWREADRRLKVAAVSPQQVQVAWIKLANKMPTGDLNVHGAKLKHDTLAVIQNARSRFPNLRLAYLSSRIYGGYAINNLNPEPYAYESAFVVRWLVQDQMKGEADLNPDQGKGPVRAPVLLWGPYLWADGTTPRGGDGLAYLRADLAVDGTHPSETGRGKVARQMLGFFQTDPLAKPWFAANQARP